MAGKSQSLFGWYDQRAKRERIVLLVCIVIVLLFLVNFFVFEPFSQQKIRAQAEVAQLQTSIADLMVRSAEVEVRRKNDPDKENRMRLVALEQEAEKLNRELETNIETLVSPREMAGLLKTLLTQQKKLQLLSLENLPPELLTIDKNKKGAETVSQPKLYRHRLRLEFSGDYLTLLKYLKQLEQLPRSLVWENVEVEAEADSYPQAKVRLQVYTLSLSEGWIGG